MTKISMKLGIIYIFLVFLNITFFTVMVFENQVDLIIDNAKFRTVEITDKLISSINSLNYSVSTSNENSNQLITKIVDILKTNVNNYVIFNEKKEIFASSVKDIEISENYIKNAINASSAKNFSDKKYSFEVSRDQISYFIPFYSEKTGDITISFIMSLKEIDNRMKNLYLQVFAIVIILIILHTLIGYLLNIIIVKPLMALKRKTDDFSSGDFSVRVKVKGNDELALVSSTFNSMAESVEQFIKRLKNQNDLLNMELEVAAQVQEGIYPKVKPNDHFLVSIYNNPLEKVSGDFHDLIKLPGNKYGFFIADVSGHGVPAALITMKIKDLITVTSSNFVDPAALLKFFNISFADLMERFSSYFTASYLILDWDSNEVLYSAAGHPDAYILRKNGTIEDLSAEGFVIGVSKEMSDTFRTVKGHIEKGDVIILYTDGITESRNAKGVFYGDKAFPDCIKSSIGKSADEIKHELVSNLKMYTEGLERKDDETLIIIEVK
ncbi:MAG: hypothetical protein A2015_04090 [Spirochaetes bacterium GWF1_31_7]|nr:MAG: hypothetical protein A2Y30_14665 [Spirochaetes bacterium GWE1_32_154]OHD48672.1 MAG: hypothetical protein A2015_04090 [Spirochaetes bacterium GWF1_31_7]OHD50197.1 MAG: hypothetical protein A2Y29_12710 [Spirochaetes bacterium GWE2_31_10]OHD82401.1 MAG: hypothetical protein A2355_01060 [Spirochaetes bacterium RIFOXYB1_FULL_32_8]HBD94022.1 hypothetical protein [Spirochaetia bacterium]